MAIKGGAAAGDPPPFGVINENRIKTKKPVSNTLTGFFYGTLIVIILGFLLLLTYYIYTWLKYGVDPPKPASYLIFESPDGLSAASTNYIFREGYQQKNFTASIIKPAINGYLKIEEEEKKTFFIKSKIYQLI